MKPAQNRLLIKSEHDWCLDTPLPNLPLRDRHLTNEEILARAAMNPDDLTKCNEIVLEALRLFALWYPAPDNLPTPWAWASQEQEKGWQGWPTKPLLDDIEAAQLTLDGFSSAGKVEETRKAAYRWLGCWRSLLRDYSGALSVALSEETEKPLTF